MIDWDAIIKAYEFMIVSKVAKLEGPGWKLYWVGSIIRIDITEK